MRPSSMFKYMTSLLLNFLIIHSFPTTSFGKNSDLNIGEESISQFMRLSDSRVADQYSAEMEELIRSECLMCAESIEERIDAYNKQYIRNNFDETNDENWSFPTTREIEIDPADYPAISGIYESKYGSPIQSILGPKEIVFTFDDGPYYNVWSKNPSSKYYRQQTTEMVLDELNNRKTRSIFFLIGNMISNYSTKDFRGDGVFFPMPDYSGHVIASHTQSHQYAQTNRKTQVWYENDIRRGLEIVYQEFGVCSRFFRFPGGQDLAGAESDRTRRNLIHTTKELGLTSMHWDFSSNDTSTSSLSSIVSHLRNQMKTKDRGIVLFHDTRRVTATNIGLLLRIFKDNGYKPVLLKWKNSSEIPPCR